MPIFRLEGDELVIAQETNLELESHLEDWLENSPVALVQDELILWIGRQTSATVEDGTIFPDLLGVDAEGNLVIVELKRDQAPRDVIAQLLEYAAWADELSDIQIHRIAEAYFETRDGFQGRTFRDTFKEIFDIPETDEVPLLNRNLRLFIVAGDIPASVARVCRFLRTSHGIDITCIDVSTFQTEAGERLVSMEVKVGDEGITTSKTTGKRASQVSPWSGDKPLDQVIWEMAQELMQGGKEYFALKEVREPISKKYPDLNPSKVNYQIYSDCVNIIKYKGSDRYWWIEKGKYRLYDPENDKVEGDGEVNQ